MKCVRCGHDSKYKDRSGKICPSCKRAFAFEPQSGDPYTDPAFQGAIERVSSQGTVKFDADHLYYEVLRIRRGPSAGAIGVLSGMLLFVAAVVISAMAPSGVVGVGLFLVFGTVVGVLAKLATTLGSAPLARHTFDRLLWQWIETHGQPAALIQPAKQIPVHAPAMSAELEAYSFDRVVITDTESTAEVLLQNGFHFENNCAILSITGHPAHAFHTVRAMLRQNPRIEVFALHDCTVEGCRLAARLRTDPEWFRDAGTVYDVALRPAQAKAYERFWTPAGFAATEGEPGISAAEAKWLAKWELQLAAIRPEQLVKRLFRAMNHMAEGGKVDEATGVMLWSTDASTSDGGGDSFG